MKKKVIIFMLSLYGGGAEKQYRSVMENIKNEYDLFIILLAKSDIGYKNKEEEFIINNPECQFYYVYNRTINNSRILKFLDKLLGIKKIKSLLKTIIIDNKIDYAMFSYVYQLSLVNYLNKNNIKCIFNERNTGRQICDKKYKIDCLKKCYKVISNSEYSANYINNKTGIKVEVINNGIKPDKIEKVSHDTMNIVVPARITKIKNQMLVLESLAYLDFNNYKVFFVGGGDKDYYDKLKKYIKQAKIDDNKIEFVGYTDKVKDYYALADMTILPSFEEGTPNVLLESYLYKILPLCSNIKMNMYCVNEKDMTFSPYDSKELSDKINKYAKLLESDKVKEILKNNYQFVMDNYSMEKMKEKYIEIFK